jgi:uncharacterized membrane protein YkvA (DUF1232 family)
MTTKAAELSVMSFYSTLQTRVDAWLASDEAVRFPHAELYRHLPGLYRFLVELALDPRVPEQERTCTLSAIKYVVAPYDLIPEAVLGTSGFRDDLVLAAMMVDRLCEACDPLPVDEHWPGAGDPREIARTILEAATGMIGTDICQRLRAWLPA